MSLQLIARANTCMWLCIRLCTKLYRSSTEALSKLYRSSIEALPKLCKSSAKALQKLCTNLHTKLCKSSTKHSTKASARALPTRWIEHAVRRGGPRGSPPWAQRSTWNSSWSLIRSSRALLTRSTDILGRLYNYLHKWLYKRLYKHLHNRLYKCPYN